jgi:methionyl aminopeptidase
MKIYMENEVLKNYKKSKEISDSVLVFAKNFVKEGTRLLDLAEKIEGRIRRLGGGIAFPVNLSVNETAAHYTPDIDDATVLKEGDLVKVDFGVHVDGYIWDRAFSALIGEKKNELIESAETAVENAVKMIKPGVKVCEISEVIENSVSSFGVKPIYNLSGHGLERFVQHAEPSILNSKNNILYEIREGQAVAIEVFTTKGIGLVKESGQTLIFAYDQDRPIRMWEARKILERAKKEFSRMPFAKRWLVDIATGAKLELALKQLVEMNALRPYPVLREESGSVVAQAEETVIVI